jgi:hypothetical protein
VTTSDPTRPPERLIDGELGELLRQANREFAAELDEPAAFRRVTARLNASRTRRLPWGMPWPVVAAPVALAAAAAVFVLAPRWKAPAAAPELVAEDWRGYRAKPDATAVASSSTVAPPSEQTPVRRAEAKNAGRAAKPSAEPPPSRPSANAAPEPASETKPSDLEAKPELRVGSHPTRAVEAVNAPDCLSLARQGQTRDAEACFLKRAEGSGLGAEMALYEVARLRRDVLADADGALRALAEYRTRFPAGSLRREADISQLELLLQLGRTDAALKQSDQLLSSSASGERAAELHLLRGHILRKAQSRFAEAAHEYELAATSGARSGEATYFRALCLEALGRGPEAAALFARYLELPQHPYADDARRRLKGLVP